MPPKRGKTGPRGDAWAADAWAADAWAADAWAADAWAADNGWGSNGWASGWASGRSTKYSTAPSSASVKPAEELKLMAAKAKDIYEELPRTGKKLWKVLGTCIQNTLSAGVIHFERDLRVELDTAVGEHTLQRQSGSQWILSMGSSKYYISVRAEVLGNPDLLSELKRTTRAVKATLLNNGAEWLHDLVDNPHLKSSFLQSAHNYQDEDQGKGGRRSAGEVEGELCEICSKPWGQDRVGGKHMCRIVVSFHCCASKWTSMAARYNHEEARVMGQKCKKCGNYGKPSDKWQLADNVMPGEGTKPHRSELCETCEKYGNCRGAFSDPFVVASALEMYCGWPARWQKHGAAAVWTAKVEDAIVVLQPHVHVAEYW
ncbi:unnamed protein product [Effrenium voratum]|uniref:3CxxC-type domain-containing protein n=1 Tax=Effrenium voratum TaxID=2562239 RepID=A0AA36IKE1_9DINO|nr:unnamed protein product [Effrenium voratum]CAJ1421216.1 unnamed protein product [Effrenium voratum]